MATLLMSYVQRHKYGRARAKPCIFSHFFCAWSHVHTHIHTQLFVEGKCKVICMLQNMCRVLVEAIEGTLLRHWMEKGLQQCICRDIESVCVCVCGCVCGEGSGCTEKDIDGADRKIFR